jgi:hypothetical protein
MIAISITFAITIIVVVFLFNIRSNKSTNAFIAAILTIHKNGQDERKELAAERKVLADRIQTGDVRQVASVNREKPEAEDKEKKRISIGTAEGLEVAKE